MKPALRADFEVLRCINTGIIYRQNRFKSTFQELQSTKDDTQICHFLFKLFWTFSCAHVNIS